MTYAPIALFVYKRPEHTRRTIEALKRCQEFETSSVFVFCDGPRQVNDRDAVQATRAVVRKLLQGQAKVFESSTNRGLAVSIMAGVNQVCAEHGCTIVVEDDLTVSEYFLNYMNAALHRYAEHERIMQISGYMHPTRLDAKTDAIFLPYISSLGWATWQRAWRHFDPDMRNYEKIKSDPELRRRFDLEGAYPYLRMLERQIAGQIDSWAIRWYLSVFLEKGLVLYPTHTLVVHEGFDRDATHGKWAYYGKQDAMSRSKISVFPDPSGEIDTKSYAHIKRYLRRDRLFLMKAIRGVRALISRFLRR